MLEFLRIFAFMVIELQCRYNKPISSDSKREFDERMNTQRMIDGENFNEEVFREKYFQDQEDQYEYGPYVFSLKDIVSFNRIDEEHIAVRFFNNSLCVFRISHESFKQLYQEITGVFVREIEV